MDEKLLRVYSDASNMAVVQAPGRRFPGVVVQGDSLSQLVKHAVTVDSWLQRTPTAPAEVVAEMRELLDALTCRAQHYERVLTEHGIPLPYGGASLASGGSSVADDPSPDDD